MTNKVTHNGKQYEIGKPYWVYDVDSDCGDLRTLEDIDEDAACQFITDGGVGWVHCEEINPNDLGKITDAPIKLEDKTPYQFDFQGNKELIGIYNAPRAEFLMVNGYVLAMDCTNIVKLVPEVK